MSGYEADLERLTSGATEFNGFAQTAGEIASGLQGLLSGFGACWGNDSVGQSFAAGHEKPTGDTFGVLGSLSEQLGGIGEKFAATAETYRHVEESNASAMKRLEG
ncbi:hypothetical protein FKR81_28880 [Lentzea tibetensis]|uniref:WXG100 family type VII secretion target n=1 Tax=Lentzea tibetensis TaxID=2591470 RepID=A0A563EM97_9PSEU|nr:hypothetical protein [Lentzea tibetensis]TWP48307.1 hypothetical protein FKR81_28880 [Lentzea tibetensis]